MKSKAEGDFEVVGWRSRLLSLLAHLEFTGWCVPDRSVAAQPVVILIRHLSHIFLLSYQSCLGNGIKHRFLCNPPSTTSFDLALWPINNGRYVKNEHTISLSYKCHLINPHAKPNRGLKLRFNGTYCHSPAKLELRVGSIRGPVMRGESPTKVQQQRQL